MPHWPPLRIGQITDLHAREAQPGWPAVVSRRGRDVLGLLPRAIARLRESGAQFLAVTGDLIEAPHYVIEPDDYYDFGIEQWIAEAEADYRQIKALLDEGGIPYIVLPGNHDYEPALWRVFDREPNVVDMPSGYRVARFCDREGDGNVPRRFDRERRLWERLLDEDDRRPQIHLQHYVVTPDLSKGYPHTYLEGEDLCARTAQSGRVALSLSGHYHQGTELNHEGPCAFATGPSFCDFPHPVRLYTLGSHGVTAETWPVVERRRTDGRRVVFLDRDGVINTRPAYSSGPEEMALLPGVARAMSRLHKAGFALVVITSQSCVGWGYVTEATVHGVHDRMCRLLRDEAGSGDAQPDAIYFSVGAGNHAVHPRYCDTSVAKPSPALLLRAVDLLGLALEGSYMVGDARTDLEAGVAAGVTPILVRTGHGRRTEQTLMEQGKPAPCVVDDLAAASDWILGRE